MHSLRLAPRSILLSCSLFASLAAALWVAPAAAAPPWQMITFKKIDADPNKTYTLAESNGPWMIMVTNFHGDNAEQQAQQLVYELRKAYRLNAYVNVQHYDYTQHDMPGIGLDKYGAPKRMCYVNADKFAEAGVLVGDYRSVDDPDGQKTLKMLKSAEPECLKAKDAKSGNSTIAEFRKMSQQVFGSTPKKAGPLGGAFLTTNPLLPRDYFDQRGVDRMVSDLNKGVEHSLLTCNGRYTVRIASFTGTGVVDQRKIQEIEQDPEQLHKNQAAGDKDLLVIGSKKAHALTEYLRGKGVEAYEFHDRSSSIVTVGSFDSLGNPGLGGKTDINPAILETIKQYGPVSGPLPADMVVSEGEIKPQFYYVKVDRKGSYIVYLPAELPPQLKKTPPSDYIMLDVPPVPIEVPKRSIGSDYRQTVFAR